MSSDFDDIYEALMSDVRNYNKIIKSNLSTYNATKSWVPFRNQKGKHGHYKTSKNHQLSIYNT